jgi:hypothetical protein
MKVDKLSLRPNDATLVGKLIVEGFPKLEPHRGASIMTLSALKLDIIRDHCKITRQTNGRYLDCELFI